MRHYSDVFIVKLKPTKGLELFRKWCKYGSLCASLIKHVFSYLMRVTHGRWLQHLVRGGGWWGKAALLSSSSQWWRGRRSLFPSLWIRRGKTHNSATLTGPAWVPLVGGGSGCSALKQTLHRLGWNETKTNNHQRSMRTSFNKTVESTRALSGVLMHMHRYVFVF